MKNKWLFIFLVIPLLAPPQILSKNIPPTKTGSSALEQVASFKSKRNADKYVKKLKKEGKKAVIRKAAANGETVYRVYVKKSGRKHEKRSHSKRLESNAAAAATSAKKRTPIQTGPQDVSAEPESAEASLSGEDTDLPAEEESVEQPPSSGEGEKTVNAEQTEAPLPAVAVQDNIPAGSPPVEALQSKSMQGMGPGEKVEIGIFEDKEDAERISREIKGKGYETIIRAEPAREGKAIYRVFVVTAEEKVQPQPLSGKGVPAAEPQELRALGEPPVGTSKTSTSPEVFEDRPRFIHANLAFSGMYTDNALSSNDQKTGGYSTVMTPEVWILLPRFAQNPLVIEGSSSLSPGGLTLSRLKPELTRRFYLFASIKADIPVLSHNLPSGNTIAYEAKGRLTYHPGGRLFLDIADDARRSFETRATNIAVAPGGFVNFDSNLFNASLYYDTSNKTFLRFDYSNFMFLPSDDPTIEFRKRVDNSFAGSFGYRVTSRASLFVQYGFTDVHYDKDPALDSKEHLFAGGLEWRVTAKSAGKIKVGYGIKDLASGERHNDVVYEAQIQHRFTPKRSLSFAAYRKTQETDVNTALFAASNGVRLTYTQLFSQKLSGSANFAYVHNKYYGSVSQGDSEGQIESGISDDMYEAGLLLQYTFSRWLSGNIGYTYSRRDSNEPTFNYSGNTFLLRILGSL